MRFKNSALLLSYFLLNFRNKTMHEKHLKLTNALYKISEFFPESDPLKNRVKDRALSIMDNLVLINKNNGWASFQEEKVKINILDDIDILLGYLWIAKYHGWINSVNYLILINEYEKLRNSIKPIVELTRSEIPAPKENKNINQNNAPNSFISQQNTTGQKPLDDKSEVPQESTQKPPASVLNTTEANVASNSFDISSRQEKILEFINRNEKAQVMDLKTVLPDVTKRTIRRDLDELLLTGKVTRLGEFNQVFYKIKG